MWWAEWFGSLFLFFSDTSLEIFQWFKRIFSLAIIAVIIISLLPAIGRLYVIAENRKEYNGCIRFFILCGIRIRRNISFGFGLFIVASTVYDAVCNLFRNT